MASQKYTVLHTGVGEALAGEVVTFPDGIDVDRLLALGAVEKAKDEKRKADAEEENSLATQQTADKALQDKK